MHSVNRKLTAISPATGKVIAEIEETPLSQVSEIYEQARAVFPIWSDLSISERITYLKKLKEVMLKELENISAVISEGTGKVKTEALTADLMPTLDAIDHISRHAESVLKRKRVKTPLLLFGKKSYIEYFPRGVVLVISPWNYPFQLAMVPVISALASGNTVILKPSEVTPLVGKCIEDLFLKAGFPEGVVQVAHGGKELGAALTKEKPDYIFFTGSVRTGKIIQEQAAKDLIPTTLELGGKDPMIIFADANLERAAKGAVWAAFTNSGQVCMSAERVYVERPVFRKFVELVKKEVEALRHGTEEDDDIGSMTFPAQREIVREQLEEALAAGAIIETGKPPSEWDDGMFLPLTVVSNVHQSMKIIQEETFGPLLPIIPFDSEDEAVKLANDTKYGLNGSVWSRDLAKARRVASKLISGSVVINDVIINFVNHYLPFGGAKQSGIGRYHGEEGLKIFCHEKAVVENSGNRLSEVHWYPYKGKYPLYLNFFKSYFSEKRDWIGIMKSYLKLMKKSRD
ncbi:aldehyde dehydrogenase family protein [Bacillus methanolicus]|uniref:Aldehyde dehydrogenase n=1 Tax=Bacillus methanolicus (strain MGA3 / ATCC 53907) TaxID=796606 RepID=I3E7Y8_BACMM|nr:aldehyde dehydrogenase family protein [Bacillus methanolicus]AIE59425.1 aldehyde dehydrogenase [Bacillus methanolicus MGA3]EIJ82609.1 aldehyde dehydrogenase [Bacillus methanolicus MGA3]